MMTTRNSFDDEVLMMTTFWTTSLQIYRIADSFAFIKPTVLQISETHITKETNLIRFLRQFIMKSSYKPSEVSTATGKKQLGPVD